MFVFVNSEKGKEAVVHPTDRSPRFRRGYVHARMAPDETERAGSAGKFKIVVESM